MRRSATAINTQHKVSRYGTSGRMEGLGLGQDALLDPGCAQHFPCRRVSVAKAISGTTRTPQLARGQEVDSD